MTTLTEDQLRKLTEAHIGHFRALIRRGYDGDKSVRMGECLRYVILWRSIQTKAYKGLTDREIGEIRDALTSGDYDELLGIDIDIDEHWDIDLKALR